MFSSLFLHVSSKSWERHEGIPSNLAQIHTFTQTSLTVFVWWTHRSHNSTLETFNSMLAALWHDHHESACFLPQNIYWISLVSILITLIFPQNKTKQKSISAFLFYILLIYFFYCLSSTCTLFHWQQIIDDFSAEISRDCAWYRSASNCSKCVVIHIYISKK